MNLFGRARSKPAASRAAPSPADAIMKLKSTLETLEKRQQHLQTRIDGQLKEAMAKKKKGDKKGALTCLKRKKMLETEQSKLEGAAMNLEQQVMTLEAQTLNYEITQGMQVGAGALRNIHARMTPDQVENTMDDIREGMADADDISNVISAPIGDTADEDELEAELMALESQELLDAPALPAETAQPRAAAPAVAAPAADATPTTVFDFPAAPTHEVSDVQVTGGTVDEDEMAQLRELEASMKAM